MPRALRWLRRTAITSLALLAAAWLFGEAEQWLLRWRAERLLADIRTLQGNRGSWVDAERFIGKWYKWRLNTDLCTPESCIYTVQPAFILPERLQGYSDETVSNWLPRIVGHLGLRTEGVRAGFTMTHGTVESTWFDEIIDFPLPGGSSQRQPDDGPVRELAAGSGESSMFAERYRLRASPSHPYRYARAIRGRLEVDFAPEEAASRNPL
jgi:hypothetical protein